jgi:hypothetical protein
MAHQTFIPPLSAMFVGLGPKNTPVYELKGPPGLDPSARFTKAVNEILLHIGDHDPQQNEYGYRMFRLLGEDQVRFFRQPKEILQLAEQPTAPQQGLFVAAALHPETKKMVIAYSYFPEDGSESMIETMLAYDEREYHKAPPHIAQWLANRQAPQSDGEFS